MGDAESRCPTEFAEEARGEDREARRGLLRAMAVDTGGRIHTIRSMSLWRGSLLVTIAAADVPRRINLPGCEATFPDDGSILEDADLPWLQG